MLAAVLLGAVVAQAVPPGGPDAAEVERIRKALAAPPTITLTPAEPREGPVFKVTIEAPISGKPWDNWSNVPTYIRPYWRLYQYEFLEQVIPNESNGAFRTSTLYPVGIPAVPLIESFIKHRAAARKRAREEQAREEVRAALAEALACHADPARPGC